MGVKTLPLHTSGRGGFITLGICMFGVAPTHVRAEGVGVGDVDSRLRGNDGVGVAVGNQAEG